MADPVVRRLGTDPPAPAPRALDSSGVQPADVTGTNRTGSNRTDSVNEVSLTKAPEPEPDTAEPPPDSLFDTPRPHPEEHEAFGELGPPVSRRAPFIRGFLTALGALAALALALAVRQASTVLVLVLVAAFLAVGLNPMVELLIRRSVRRGWAVLIVTVVVMGVIAGIVAIAAGPLRDQVTRLIDAAPRLLGELRDNAAIRHFDEKFHFIRNLQHKLSDPNFATNTFGGIYNVGISLFTAAADIVIVFVLTLYFLAALPQLKRGLFSLAPASRRDRVGQLGDEILRRVGRYVIGAAAVALLAGTVSFVFLNVVGLGDYALPLALLVALLDLVPLVGSIIGASLVTIVGLADSASVGIACVIFYVIYESLEGYVIYPRVMRSSVDIPEYVSIVAVLLGGTIAGIVGALLALPMAAAGLLLVREVWIRQQDLN